jgi:hypothetical protein
MNIPWTHALAWANQYQNASEQALQVADHTAKHNQAWPMRCPSSRMLISSGVPVK